MLYILVFVCVCVYIYRLGSEVFDISSFIFKFRGPEGEVISDQLHDGGGILVLIFLDGLDVSNGVIESLFIIGCGL